MSVRHVQLLLGGLLSSLLMMVLAGCGNLATSTPPPVANNSSTITTVSTTTSASGSPTTASGSNSTVSDSSTGNTQVVKLRYVSWTDQKSAAQEQGPLDQFNKTHPNIQVEYQAWGASYDDKLSTSIAAGDTPDVMAVWNFPKYASALLPLDDYLAKTPTLTTDFTSQGILNFATFNKHVYGLPNGWTGRVIYYNKKLFDAAGLPYPTDDWTWDELAQMATKLTDKSKGQWGFGADTDLYTMQSYFWNNGADLLSPDGKTSKGYLDSPATKDTIAKFYGLYKQGSLLLNIAGDQGTSMPAVDQAELFKSGKLAMMDNGVWQVEEWKKAGIDLGAVRLPRMSRNITSNQRVGLLHASFFAVAKTTKNADAAWQLAQFLASYDFTRYGHDFSARKSINSQLESDPAQIVRTPKDPLNTAQFATLDAATKQPWFLRNGNWAEGQRLIQNGIQSILLQGTDIDLTLSALVSQVDNTLK